MIEHVDLSPYAVTLTGLKDAIEDCQHMLDQVKPTDNNSKTLLDIVQNHLAMLYSELSELQQRE